LLPKRANDDNDEADAVVTGEGKKELTRRIFFFFFFFVINNFILLKKLKLKLVKHFGASKLCASNIVLRFTYLEQLHHQYQSINNIK